MKISKFLIATLFSLISFKSLFSQTNVQKKEIIDELRKQNEGKFLVIDYEFGHFLSIDEESVLVIMDNWKNRFFSPEVEKICVYKIKKNKTDKKIELNEVCSLYPDGLENYYFKQGISLSCDFPLKIHSFGFTGDINGNGLDEIILHVDSNLEGTTILIKEFCKNKFETVLPAANDISVLKNVDLSSKELCIKRTKYDSKTDSFYSEDCIYFWNEVENKYKQVQ